jgi:hypothetical protein
MRKNFLIKKTLIVPLLSLVITILAYLIFSSSNGWLGINAHSKSKNCNDLILSVPNFSLIVNLGQLDEKIAFYTDIPGGRISVTKEAELLYSLRPNTTEFSGIDFKECFAGNKNISFSTDEICNSNINVFLGNDSTDWIKGIPAYNKIKIKNIYDGIDLSIEVNRNTAEKIFKLNPGSDVNDLRVLIKDADLLSIGSDGKLIVETSGRSASFTKPIAYQDINNERNFVSVEYKVSDYEYGFEVGAYNSEFPLFIDPLLASTYLGGSQTDLPYGPFIEVDDSGYVYVCGFSSSLNFPRTQNAFQNNYSGQQDCFISKFNNDLTELIASTYLGGSGFETECTIELDDEGNVYVGGYTNSTDFPTTPGAYNQQNNGDYDIFISKLSNDLSTLLASTYIGGSNTDGWYSNRIDLEIGNNGDLYLVGQTTSDDFPVTSGVYDSTFNGTGVYTYSGDAVVIRFDNTLSNLVASTYLGGTLDEFRVGMALDAEDNVFVVTGTYSWDIATPAVAIDPSYNGASDLYISKLSSDLTTQLNATYFGATEMEVPHVAETDNYGNLFVSGYTTSPNFQTTPGSFDDTYNGNEDGFVIKFDNNLNSLVASTFIGGSQHDRGQALKIKNNKLFLTGKTLSSDFPVITGTYDDEYSGGTEHGDIFISTLDLNLSTLSASTYLGGEADEKPLGLAVDKNENVFIGGFTHSGDYPFTAGAYDSTFAGVIDVVVAKLYMESSVNVDNEDIIPFSFQLSQNYPNPFNPNTVINYVIPEETNVKLLIYNLTGQVIRTLVNVKQNAGSHSVIWDGKNNKGGMVSSGVYLYRIVSKNFNLTKKMLLIK